MVDTHWLFYRTETNPKLIQEFWSFAVGLRVFLTSAVSHLLNNISSGERWTWTRWIPLYGGGSKVWWCWWCWNTALFFSPLRSPGQLIPVQALLEGSAMITASNHYGIIWYHENFKRQPWLWAPYIAHQCTGKNLPPVLWRELEGNISLSSFLSSAMPKGKQEKFKEVAMIIPK